MMSSAVKDREQEPADNRPPSTDAEFHHPAPNRRFALTRWWSGGDLNWRSAFALLDFGKGLVSR
jgi:hypothetical protein